MIYDNSCDLAFVIAKSLELNALDLYFLSFVKQAI
jgi:hypothetical protein